MKSKSFWRRFFIVDLPLPSDWPIYCFRPYVFAEVRFYIGPFDIILDVLLATIDPRLLIGWVHEFEWDRIVVAGLGGDSAVVIRSSFFGLFASIYQDFDKLLFLPLWVKPVGEDEVVDDGAFGLCVFFIFVNGGVQMEDFSEAKVIKDDGNGFVVESFEDGDFFPFWKLGLFDEGIGVMLQVYYASSHFILL